jgi:TolA-binding protein
MALLESAKLMESMGKTAEAKAKYKELTDKFPKSILAVEAKAKLGG